MSSTTASSSSDSPKVWSEKVTDEDLKRLAILDDGREILEIKWNRKNGTMGLFRVEISDSISVSELNKVTQRLNATPGFSELPPAVKFEVWASMQWDESVEVADWSPKAMKQVIRMALEKFDN